MKDHTRLFAITTTTHSRGSTETITTNFISLPATLFGKDTHEISHPLTSILPPKMENLPIHDVDVTSFPESVTVTYANKDLIPNIHGWNKITVIIYTGLAS